MLSVADDNPNEGFRHLKWGAAYGCCRTLAWLFTYGVFQSGQREVMAECCNSVLSLCKKDNSVPKFPCHVFPIGFCLCYYKDIDKLSQERIWRNY